MFEHVGKGQLAKYFTSVQKMLEPGGIFLNHGIVTRDRPQQSKPGFVDVYVFPDRELVTASPRITTGSVCQWNRIVAAAE